MQGLRPVRGGLPPKVLRLSERLNHYGYHYAEYLGAGCSGCGICFFACPEPGGITVLKLAAAAAVSPAAAAEPGA